MSVTINGTSGLTFNDASVQNTAASGFGFKNRLINGACMIDQRNAGASVTINSGTIQYAVDRFGAYGQSTDGVFTVQQSTNAPAGFTNSLIATVTTADASIGSTQEYGLVQSIEGLNVADLGWGTANAQTVTLSFWARSSVTGTHSGALSNSAFARAYVFSYTISVANTWEYKTVTIAGDTTGTWLTSNGTGIRIRWNLGTGSSYLGTAGSWGGFLNGATGSVQLISTLNATFQITGVQLEKGSTATSFDYRPYGTELQLCQRYFQVIAQGADQPIATAFYVSSTVINSTIPFKTTMRATPTLSITTGTNFYSVYRQSADDFVNSLSIDTVSPNVVAASNNSEASGTSGVAGLLLSRNASSFLAAQSEL